MKKRLLIVFSFFALCNASCISMVSEVKNWIEASNIEDVIGKYHFLNDNGIKIYLPDTFKKYSTPNYLKLIDSIASETDYTFEAQAIKTLRDMEGEFYIYFDELFGVTYTVNTLPHFPFSRKDASQLLGIIRLNNEKISKKQDINFTKVTAKYRGNEKQQIFKSIYKVDHQKTDISIFSTAYIISSNKKTVMIKLSSIYEIDFDPFIQKMIM